MTHKSLRAFLGLFFTLLSGQAFAHEYWIEPTGKASAPYAQPAQIGDHLQAHIRVGTHFTGTSQAYFSKRFESFDVRPPLGAKLINTRPAQSQRPAFQVLAQNEGSYIGSLVTQSSQLHWKDWSKFTAFLDYEGLEDYAQRHKERGLPLVDFYEDYRRAAKVIWTVGKD